MDLKATPGPRSCDRLFVGGEVADGAGGAPFAASVAVTGDRIVGVGDAAGWTSRDIIDVAGLTVCPGFIDCHTHDDHALLAKPRMTPKVSQGVTTVITGNCGISLAPLAMAGAPPAPMTEVAGAGDFRFASFAAYLEALRQAPAAVNAACLVGHSTLRIATMPRLDRPADESEIRAMEALCRAAMAAGAIGLSSGLFYPPAKAAPASEVVRLARIAGQAGGVYTTHLRDEADRIVEALEEALQIAEIAGTPLIVSHHKLIGRQNAGRSAETLALLARARARQRVAFDAYPYVAGSTMLGMDGWENASAIMVSWSGPRPEAAGRYLADLAAEMNLSQAAAMEALSPGGGIYFMMDEADVRRVLSSPHAMFGSDGLPMSVRPHPRLWGTFTRVLGHYARDEQLFPFGEAVRRMSGLTAAEFGLKDRGVIAPGAFADLVVLDRAQVLDLATFEDPEQPSRGIRQVCVNGADVWRDGKPTDARPGRVLTH